MTLQANQHPAPIEGFRVSPQQAHLWKLQTTKATPFTTRAVIRIDGRLVLDQLRAAVRDVVEHHEILRTTFHELPGQSNPVQVVRDSSEVVIDVHDVTACPPGEVDEIIDAFLAEAGSRPFNTVTGPQLRLTLVTLSQEKQVLQIDTPALVSDSSGLRALVRQIGKSYASRAVGERYSPDVKQYADITEWQHELLEANDTASHRAFGRSSDRASDSRLTLPEEKGSHGLSPFTPRVYSSTLRTTGDIRRLAAKYHASSSMVLLACWTGLLWRLTGRDDVVVGTRYEGRMHEELSESIGLFAKLIPLYTRLDASMTFPTVLAHVQDAAQQADKRQDFFNPYQREKNTTPQQRDALVCFEFTEQPAPVTASDVRLTMQHESECIDAFTVKLSCHWDEEILTVSFQFDSGLFDPGAIARLAAQYGALLASVVTQPDRPIAELDILGDAERRRLLSEFNDTAAAYPADRCIHQLFEEQVERTPSHTAVSFEGNNLSYAELNGRANQLARRLRTIGIGPNRLVGICMERSEEMVVSILGVLKAGGAYVPIDPSYPKSRLAFMLEDTATSVLLTTQHLMSALPAYQGRVMCVDSEWESIASESTANPAVEVAPDNLVYVIYTSGSTGQPKGVLITHRGLVISNCARVAYYNEERMLTFLLLSSFSFDSSVVGIFWTLCQGGTLLLIPEEAQRDPATLCGIIQSESVSHLLTLPSFYSLILEHAQPGQLDSLSTAIVAGEPCPKRMVDRHKALAQHTGLFSEYGATETTVFSSVYDCLNQEIEVAPVGAPVANAQMYVLDSRQQPVPVGVSGEVYFGGDALSPGYLNRPRETADRFVPHPFSEKPGARLYRSGDLARHLPNGDVEFLGRLDNQVKIRGFRIELEEIEAALASHVAVREVAVVAKAASNADEHVANPSQTPVDEAGGKRLVAYIAYAPGNVPAMEELRDYLTERLPDYMVPALFEKLDALPKTPNGKVDRQALPEPGNTRPDLHVDFVAPRSSTERTLAEIWAQVLGLERVGVHDNFFELGGDSILSIQITARAKRSGVGITPVQVFQHQTVSELAEASGVGEAPSAEQGEVTGSVPLTPIQHWFIERGSPNPNHWNMTLLLTMRRAISPSRLEEAAQAVLRHHDALRLRLIHEDSTWRQSIDAYTTMPVVDTVDISAVSIPNKELVFERKAAEYQASLNLVTGPLMRLVVFNFGPAQPARLLWVLHHMAADVVSWQILLEDLETALDQLSDGATIQLLPKTTSFKRWSEELIRYAESDAQHDEVQYWFGQAWDDVDTLPIDFTHATDANTEGSTQIIRVQLNKSETEALVYSAPRSHDAQITEILLAALAQAFCEWTDAPALLVDVEGHGRESQYVPGVDLSRTVGWFTTFCPVLLSVDEGADVGTNIRMVRDQLREIPAGGFRFGLLKYLSTNASVIERFRDFSQPQVNFNYLGQLGQLLRDSSWFELAPTGIGYGPDRSNAGLRSHVVEVVAYVRDSCLFMDWSYSEDLHQASTIEQLADVCVARLRTMIAHAELDGLPAARLAEFQWDQSELEKIAAAIRNVKAPQ